MVIKIEMKGVKNIAEAISNDKDLVKRVLGVKIVSEPTWSTPMFCALSIGLGRFNMAILFYSVFAAAFFYVRHQKSIIRSRLEYISLPAQGKTATNRWEEAKE